jgi:hypothetical protein
MKKEKKEKVVGVRLTPTQYTQLHKAAEGKHVTASTVGRVLIEMFLRQEVRI